MATSASTSPRANLSGLARAGIGRNAAEAAATLAGRPLDEQAPASADDRSPRRVFWDSFRAHRAAYYSLIVLSLVIGSCVFLPIVLPWSSTEIDFGTLSATPPSLSHPLGTDQLGRDELARLLTAGRISLLIGLMVAVLSAGMGAIAGITAGYFGGRTEGSIMWVVGVLMTIPSLPLLIALSSVASSEGGTASAIFGAVPPEWRIIVIMSLLGWMGISRVVRSQVISLRRQEFVEAATALGSSHRRIMTVHILPNTVSVLAVFTTLAVSAAIMGESALSFLGLGVTPPTATWGNMLLESKDVFTAVQYWWLTWPPALMILITILCVNFCGDGLRDAFDPKARR